MYGPLRFTLTTLGGVLCITNMDIFFSKMQFSAEVEYNQEHLLKVAKMGIEKLINPFSMADTNLKIKYISAMVQNALTYVTRLIHRIIMKALYGSERPHHCHPD